MKKIRYIPFGYEIINGQIALNEQESNAVKVIFSSYLQGASYTDIARQMTEKGLPYHENNSRWNKCMVKRILENETYMNRQGYSQIVSEVDFQQVPLIQNERDKNKNPQKTLEPSILKRKALCYECGGRYLRHTKNVPHEKWYCENVNCHADTRITDLLIKDTVTEILNAVIANQSILAVENNNSPTYAPTLEITRLNNEIYRQLEKRDFDAGNVKSLILQCAAEKYKCCGDSSHHITETLKADFAMQSPLSYFSAELFDRTVSNLLIAKDGTIHVKFINGVIRHNAMSTKPD
jgi:hypothetical protein